MVDNLVAGTVLVTITTIVHSVGLATLSRFLRWLGVSRRLHLHRMGGTTIMLFAVLGIFAIHAFEIWIWAVAYLAVGALPDFHDALFFSTLCFSTLGAEQISTTPEWDLFGSIEGVNGFLLIGWSTAYLVPVWTLYGATYEQGTT